MNQTKKYESVFCIPFRGKIVEPYLVSVTRPEATERVVQMKNIEDLMDSE